MLNSSDISIFTHLIGKHLKVWCYQVWVKAEKLTDVASGSLSCFHLFRWPLGIIWWSYRWLDRTIQQFPFWISGTHARKAHPRTTLHNIYNRKKSKLMNIHPWRHEKNKSCISKADLWHLKWKTKATCINLNQSWK